MCGMCFVESEKSKIWSVECSRRVACEVCRVLNVKCGCILCAVWSLQCRV